ncbi:di-N-acetylchitobiase-like [Diadema antillarum]|uniref:di-N-acetylchitobiase-like n=1 Tax=Diadema antillarum TaxID=105358 RepID=UPI003A86BC0D
MSASVPRTTFLCMVLSWLCATSTNGNPLSAPCPCSDSSLCDPIKTTPKREVVMFASTDKANNNWKSYEWDNFTTLAIGAGFDPQIMCHAHSKGVRIVAYGSFSPATLFNETASNLWIEENVRYAVANFTDGFNIDYETPLPASRAHFLTDVVNRTAAAFRKALPYSKVSLDSAYTANCTLFGRCYDYVKIAEIVDFIFIMAYDEVNQFSPVANANAPLHTTTSGVDDFLRQGIPASKLVLGVPWYGYDFICNKLTPSNECYRTILKSEEISYGPLMKLLAHNSSSGRLWSDADKSPYFNYKDSDTNLTHQIWYDDPSSLKLRYQLAKDKELYGVGAFNADCLDYSTDETARKETKAMWDAIGEFKYGL